MGKTSLESLNESIFNDTFSYLRIIQYEFACDDWSIVIGRVRIVNPECLLEVCHVSFVIGHWSLVIGQLSVVSCQ